jgi:hypothetical protein
MGAQVSCSDRGRSRFHTHEVMGARARPVRRQSPGRNVRAIGPPDGDGGVAIDAGKYFIVMLGKTKDGKVVGFYVKSVET